jgi:hypothetical protein
MQSRWVGVAGIIAALVAACLPSPEDSEEATFRWLQPGKNTQEEVVLRLGMPRDAYEAERVFVYPLAACQAQWWISTAEDLRGTFPCAGSGGFYDLVIVFDADGTVATRSIVKPRTLVPGQAGRAP